MDTVYTVWVGGVEVNDYYMDKKDAEYMAEFYKDEGYDDVVIQELNRKEV